MSPKVGKNDTIYLDKLAQLEHPLKINKLQGQKKLQKRAKAKFMTNALTYQLTRLNSPLRKSYVNTYFCASTITQVGNTLTSSYCNNRWCITCNRIRTAKLINGYLEPLQALPDPHFVTLTIPNVTADVLAYTINDMLNTLSSIIHRWQVHHKNDKINGVRKIECTYNSDYDNYHPHIHLIVGSIHSAQHIVNQWLEHYDTARSIAQNIRHCDTQQSMLELFKYFTKILTNKNQFYAPQMDIIFQAMRNKRVYQPFGSIHPVKEDIDDIQAEEYNDIANQDRLWKWFECDWVDEETGEMLSEYMPSEAYSKLIKSIMNKKS